MELVLVIGGLTVALGGALLAILRGSSGSTAWRAQVGGRDVHLQGTPSRVVFVVQGAPPGLRVLLRGAHVALPDDLIVSGDDELDRCALLAGDGASVLAMLDEEGRVALRVLVEAGMEIDGGVVRGAAPLREVYARLVVAGGVLQVLRARGDPLRELLSRLAAEPVPGVRRRLGEVLAAHGLQDAMALSTATDPDPSLRLRSALIRADADAMLDLLHGVGVPSDVREAAWRALRDGHLARVVERLVGELDDLEHAPGALARLAALPGDARRGVGAAHVRRLRADPRRYATEGELLVWLLTTDPDGVEALLELARHAPAHVARLAIPHLLRGLPADRLNDLAAERADLQPALGELLPAAMHKDRQRRLLRDSCLEWSAGVRSALGEVEGFVVEIRFATHHDVLLVRGVPEIPPLSFVPGRSGGPLPGWLVADVPQVLAWLPGRLRETAERAAEQAIELRIGEGWLLCSVVLRDGDHLTARLGRLVALARALTELASVPLAQRVRRAFLEEPAGDVRRRFAALAFEADSKLAATCVADPDLEVRRAAARACGAMDVLVELAASSRHARSDRLAALVDLEELDREALSRAIEAVWSEPVLRPHALLAIGRCRRSEHAGRVVALLDELGTGAAAHGSPGFGAAVGVLASLDAPEAEPALIRGLQITDPDLKVRILAALGRIGTAQSVPVLRRLGEGWTAEGKAARLALAEIRARAGVGGLALSEPVGGEVALAASDGRLSEVEPA